MPQGKFDENHNGENQDRNPPCEELENLKEDDHDCGKSEKNTFPQGHCDELAGIPCMQGNFFPDKIEKECAAHRDTEKCAQKECGERLERGGKGTDPEKNRDERGDRKERGQCDAEEEGVHGGMGLGLGLGVGGKPSFLFHSF